MNLVLEQQTFEKNNIFFQDAVKNTVMNDSNFIRIIYSNKEIILNGIYIKNSDIKKTIKVGNALMKEGVELRSAFWPLNEQEGFKFKYVGNKKVCKDVFAKSIILPSAYNMSIKDIKNIKKILNKILDELRI